MSMENSLKVSQHIRGTQGKYLRYGKYGEFRVVCGAQNRLQIPGKCLNIFKREYAERMYAYMKKTQRDTWGILLIAGFRIRIRMDPH
jgi:hypothetical protein